MSIGSRTIITVKEKEYAILHEKTSPHDNESYAHPLERRTRSERARRVHR